MLHIYNRQANQMLGYPDDARLLILNADDFGMCHAVNAGILQAITEGVVTSTSLMVPCPWALHAMEQLKAHPDVPFGIHLTLICDQAHYKWRPLTSPEKAPSLVDETGFCYPIGRMEEFLAQAQLDELELEFRAQIETVLAAGLKPTHLDWHCILNGGRPDMLDLSVRLAKEYGLAVRADNAVMEGLQSRGLPTSEYPLLDSYNIDPATKTAVYTQMLRELPPGLSEWAVHPAIDSREMQAMEADSWQIRTSDYAFLMSPDARAILEQEGIILLSYRPLQAVWVRENT